MAIAFDNAITLGQSSASSNPSQTTSYTATGSNIALLVWCGTTDTTNDRIAGVTWGGVSLTRVNRQAYDGSIGIDMCLYALFGATAGTSNIVISTTSGSSIVVVGTAAASYTGVLSSSADASTTNKAIATSYTTSLTTIADNCWTVMGTGSSNSSGHSAGTGTTQRFGNAQGGWGLYDSGGVIHPAGSTSLIITGTSQSYMSNMISISPTGAAVATANPAFLLNFI